MIKITSCDNPTSKRKYVRFVYDLYKDDPSFVATAVFELESYLFQKSRQAKELYIDAILISKNDEISVACMLFFSKKMPFMQIGFFEAKENAQEEVNEMLLYAEKKAKKLHAKKIVIGLNGHVSIGVGLLKYKCNERKIAFNSIYGKLYYPDYFRQQNLTESRLTTYRGYSDIVLDLINNRSIAYEDIQLRAMNKQNFRKEIELMTQISNNALKETELYYAMGNQDLYHRLKKIKFLLKPYDLLYVLKDGKEIGYLFTHPDFNQLMPPGKKISRLFFALQILFRSKNIDTLKVNSVCMTEKRNVGLQHLIKVRTSMARKQGYKYLESNFIFDSNRLSTLFALRQGYKKYNTYSIFYKKIENA